MRIGNPRFTVELIFLARDLIQQPETTDLLFVMQFHLKNGVCVVFDVYVLPYLKIKDQEELQIASCANDPSRYLKEEIDKKQKINSKFTRN